MDDTKVLLLGLEGSDGLMRSLQAVWQMARAEEFDLREEIISSGDLYRFPDAAIRVIARMTPDLLIVCLARNSSGQTPVLLESLRQNPPDFPVVLVLESAEDEGSLAALKLLASDFVIAPVRAEDLLPRLRCLRWNLSENERVVSSLKISLGLKQFVGVSPALMSVIRQIPRLAKCDASVLITGETGTGKEMVARAIHYLSARAGHPFIPVNCGAIPLELVENELFGHEAGAFTGANSKARGLIYDAREGTLFLDEIDALPLQTQVKLLRFLQNKEYRPLGSGKACQANIRVVAASNANMEEAVRAGKFRSDLFYRVSILPLNMPPLRERKQDIPLLARHFAQKFSREMNRPAKELSQAALQKLQCHHWPGNVRELENIIQRAVVLAEEPTIRSADIVLPGQADIPQFTSFKALKARMILHFEQTYLQELLAAHEGNITRAAKAANKNRRAFFQLLRKHNLQMPASRTPPESRADKLRLR